MTGNENLDQKYIVWRAYKENWCSFGKFPLQLMGVFYNKALYNLQTTEFDMERYCIR